MTERARYLVTGGAGFIGSNLAGALLEAGHGVAVLDDLSSGHRANLDGLAGDLDVIDGSITDDAAVRRAAAGAAGIFHLAAIPSVPRSVEHPLRTEAVNVGGFLRVLLAARDTGVPRVVLASSSAVYGESETLPKVETMTPAPLSPYAAQKLACEHYGAMALPLYGVEVVSVRYFNVFGPRQDPASEYAAVIPRFITMLLRGERPTIFGDGGQSRDFTYVDDVVHGTIRAMHAPAEAAGQVFNLACGGRQTLLELVSALQEITGRQDVTPIHEEPRKGDVRHSQASIERARAVLGFEPRVPFTDGLRRTVAYFAEQAGR